MQIEAKNLTKRYRIPVRQPGMRAALRSLAKPQYNVINAVEDVSFTIGSGEMVGFIGPNGAGKTTTLKMLSGLLYPTSGEALVSGYVPWKRQSAYLKKISMLMGNRSQLQWNNTVYDSMIVFRDIYGIPGADFEKTLRELTELLELGDLLTKQARNLSLGERSKCEFMAALLHRPEVVYLDEPTLGMDVTMQLRLRGYIKQYNARYESTVMLTSHYMSDILSLCPRLLLIHKGKLLFDGNVNALIDRVAPYRLVKLTFGEDKVSEAGCAHIDGAAFDVLDAEGFCMTLRVRKDQAMRVAQYFMDHYALVDLSMQEPSIEDVIDQIYRDGGVA